MPATATLKSGSLTNTAPQTHARESHPLGFRTGTRRPSSKAHVDYGGGVRVLENTRRRQRTRGGIMKRQQILMGGHRAFSDPKTRMASILPTRPLPQKTKASWNFQDRSIILFLSTSRPTRHARFSRSPPRWPSPRHGKTSTPHPPHQTQLHTTRCTSLYPPQPCP